MRLAVSNIAWSPDENNLVFPILNRMGVKGIEIAPTTLWSDPTKATPSEIENIKEYFFNAGFTIPAAQALLFNHPELTIFSDENIRQNTLDYLKSLCSICAKIGIPRMVFGSPKNRQKGNLSFNQALEIASDFFFDLAEYISPFGIVLCLEPNPVEYGCDFILNSSDALTLINQVNHPNFKLQLDTSSIFLNWEDPYQVISSCIQFIRHCHISEPYLGLLGEAESDHKAIANNLQLFNYGEWISIEMKSGLMQHNSEAILKSLQFVTDIYLK